MRKTALTILLILSIIPLAYADDTNLAPMPNGWDLTYGEGAQIISWNTSVTRLGAGSIVLDRHVEGVDVNSARECDSDFLAVNPGDNVTFRVWIKADPSQYNNDSTGARIGIDLWYTNDPPNWGTEQHNLWGIHESTYYNPHNDTDGTLQFVHHNTLDWTMREINFTVPSLEFNYDQLSHEYFDPHQQANIICGWLQVWDNSLFGTDPAKGYFADAELYINPTGYNQTNPTPTPSPAYFLPDRTAGGLDALMGLGAVLAVFTIIIWPFVQDARRRF